MTLPEQRAAARIPALATASIALLTSLQHESGAYPASPTFSAYRGYSWFRDGAFIADAVSAAGEVASASRFFDWCARILEERAPRVDLIVAAAASGTPSPDEDMLATRFLLDGGEGRDDWWDFQLDGYGTWIWAAVEHAERHGLALERWASAISLSVEYLVSSWNRPCFDWWEEHSEQVHVSTLGCIVAGLRAACATDVLDEERRRAALEATSSILEVIDSRGVVDGHLVKWLDGDAVDASLLSLIAPLGVFEASSPIARATIDAVSGALNVDGGVHRFLGDTFYGGGQWPLLSCMLGLAREAAGDRAGAETLLEWAASTANATGELPEQVANDLLDPSRRAEWVQRWGEVATPLLWSHAMFLRLALQLNYTVASHQPLETS